MVAAEDELVAVNLMEQVKQVLNEYNKRKRVITRSEGFAVAKTSNAKPSCTVIAMRLSTSLQTSADCTEGKLRSESPQWMQYSKRPRFERSN